MKIAITGPHYWPYWRRGSASYIHNLAKYLTEQSHEVEIVTSKPGKKEILSNGKLTITYHRYLQHPLLLQHNIDRIQTFALSCSAHFLKKNYDLIHCIYHSDGFAAYLLKKLKRLRYVFHVTVTPFKLHFQNSEFDHYLFKKAISSADQCIAPSIYAREHLKREYDIDATFIPCGVDTNFFSPNASEKQNPPRILFTAPLYDERKQPYLLLKSFELLIKDGTNAILQLAGETTNEITSSFLSRTDPEIRKFIEVIYPITYQQLPKVYASASVTVLPSISETFGMTLLESLASGTPVVGTKSGAIPEIISNPSIGSLFEMKRENDFSDNAVNLFKAIKRTLKLTEKPETINRCCQHATQYSWRTVGKEMESLYNRVMIG
jgi:phosphatidylinositol alpha-mannosyltransferase